MIHKGLIYFIALLSFAYGLNASAQVGRWDTTFFRGIGFGDVYDGLENPDSSIIIAGNFAYANQRTIRGLAKLYPNGTTDYTFNAGGSGSGGTINVVHRLENGQYLIGGGFSTYNGVTTNKIARINADGTKDVSFTTNINGEVKAMIVQNDSMIVVAGGFTTVNGVACSRISRLKYDGTRDTSFNPGTINNNIWEVRRQADGKYLISGEFTTYNGATCNRVARLNANGTLDTTFHTGTGASANTISIAIAPSGKIYLGGMPIYNGDTVNRLVRLNADGSRDTTFKMGSGLNNYPYDFLLQDDGKLVMSGNFSSYNGQSIAGLLRVDSTGKRDTTFAVGTGLTGGIVHHVSLCNDGRYLFLGEFTLANNFIHYGGAKINSNGSLHHDFMSSQFTNNNIRQVATQSNGKVILAGEFTKYRDKDIKYLARLNSDGSIDTTFNMGTGLNNVSYSVAIQPDDKIIIGGAFTSYNGKSTNRIARLNSDGSYDTTFNVGTGFNSYILDIEILPSGKMFVGGSFTSYKGAAINRLVLLNADGSRDNTFSPPTFNNNTVTNILPMPDGKLIVSGEFNQVNGTAHNNIIKLHVSGAIDTSFRGGTGFDGGLSNYVPLLLQPDGKIVVGFSSSRVIDGVTRSRVARLHPNGRIDTSFDPSNTALSGGWVQDLQNLNTGILASGSIPGYIKYLDKDGNADAVDFASNMAGGGGNIYSIHKDSNHGRILAGGIFWTFGQVYAAHLVSLWNYLENPSIAGPVCRGGITKVYFDKRLTFDSGNTFTVQLSDSLGSFASSVAVGTVTRGGWGPDSVQVTIPMYKGNGTGYKVRIVSTAPAYTGAGSSAFTIGPLSPPVITADSIFCYGDSIQLSTSLADTYAWGTGDTSRNIWVDTSGTYTVSVSINNCAATSADKVVSVFNASALPIVQPYGILMRSDTCYSFSVDSFGVNTDSVEWTLGNAFDTTYLIANGSSIVHCVTAGTMDTVWFRPYIPGLDCKGNISYVALMVMKPPVEVLWFNETGIVQEVHVQDKLEFTVPDYFYPPTDSVDFYYRIKDTEGNIVTGLSNVGYSSSGNYEISSLGTLFSGERYTLELVKHNGNTYSFIFIKN